jgi:hypothetical protein
MPRRTEPADQPDLSEWDSGQLKIEAPQGTPSPLREVYAAVAQAVFEAWQARYKPTFDSRMVFKEAVARPLANALTAARKLLDHEEVLLRARTPDAFDAFQAAMKEVERINFACGHVVLGTTSASPTNYLLAQPAFNAYALLDRMRETTCQASYSPSMDASLGPADSLAGREHQRRESAPCSPDAGRLEADREPGVEHRPLPTTEPDTPVELRPVDQPLPDGPFDGDGFRFQGREIRFRRAAKQQALVLALWDATKRRPRAKREIEKVMTAVYGANHDTEDSTFRQLCSDTQRRLDAANIALRITSVQGKVCLEPRP